MRSIEDYKKLIATVASVLPTTSAVDTATELAPLPSSFFFGLSVPLIVCCLNADIFTHCPCATRISS